MTPSLIIKEATLDDVPAITEIYNEAIEADVITLDLYPMSIENRKNWLLDRDAKRYPVFVGELDGKIIGFGAINPYSNKQGFLYTAELSGYLRPGFQRKGMGEQVMAYLLQMAKKLGFHTLVGHIVATNLPSIHNAEKAGFIRVGTLQAVGHKFGQWHDVHIYQKMLS